MMPQLLRALAIVIAVAAVIDPAVTTMRTTRPEIALVADDSSAEREAVARVARELEAEELGLEHSLWHHAQQRLLNVPLLA